MLRQLWYRHRLHEPIHFTSYFIYALQESYQIKYERSYDRRTFTQRIYQMFTLFMSIVRFFIIVSVLFFFISVASTPLSLETMDPQEHAERTIFLLLVSAKENVYVEIIYKWKL